MPDPQQQFQYIKLPDGSYGKFSSSASDDQIRTAIAKDFPQAFQASPQQQPSAMPSAADWFHAAGLPANPSEGDMTPGQAAKMGAMNILHAADPTYLFRSVVGPMAKEGTRALKGIWEHGGIPQPMDAIHAASAVNPFAAPVVSQMTDLREQGKEGEATATGVLGAGALGLGLRGMRGRTTSVPDKAPTSQAAPQLPFLKSSQPAPPQQVAEQPVATERGTWSADPRSGEEILQSAQDMRGGGQGKVAMGVSQGTASAPSGARPGFGTAQVPIEETQQGADILAQRAANRPPVPEAPPVASPVDPKQFYGKTPTRSSLKANQRQLASPTGSTAPGQTATPTAGPHPPNIMKILNTPGDISDADMQTVQNYFAQKKLTNMLKGASSPFPQVGDAGISPLGRGIGPDTLQTPQISQTYPHLGKPIPQAGPIPQQGQFAAIRTEDGQIFADPKWQQSTHIAFMKRSGIPPDKVADSGWLIDGVYEPADRGDIAAYSERAKAALRLETKQKAAGQ